MMSPMLLGVLVTLSVGLTGMALGFRNGLMSPGFLFMFLYTLGVPLRAVFLSLAPDEILAPWAISAHDTNDLSFAMLDMALGGIAVLAGYVISSSKQNERLVLALAGPFRTPTFTVERGRIILFLGLGSISVFLLFLLRIESNPVQLFWMLQSRVVTTLAGQNYVTLLLDLAVLAAMLLVFYDSSHKSMALKPCKWVLLCLSLAGLILLGGRGSIVQFAIMTAVVSVKAKVFPSITVIRYIFAFLVVLILGLALRLSVQTKTPVPEATAEVLGNSIASISNAAPLVDAYALSRQYVMANGHDNGRQLLAIPLRIVPKTLYNERPTVTALKIREQFWNDGLSGTPAGIFGDLYIIGGLGALTIGSIYAGFMVGIAETTYRLAMNERSLSPLSAILVSFCAITFLRSGLELGIMNILVDLSLLYLLMKVVGATGTRQTLQRWERRQVTQ
jgi:hypothetical protein